MDTEMFDGSPPPTKLIDSSRKRLLSEKCSRISERMIIVKDWWFYIAEDRTLIFALTEIIRK